MLWNIKINSSSYFSCKHKTIPSVDSWIIKSTKFRKYTLTIFHCKPSYIIWDPKLANFYNEMWQGHLPQLACMNFFVKIGKRINFVAASILHLPVTNLASFSAVKYIWLRGILPPSENLGEIPACEQNHAKILGTGFQTRL